VEKDNIEEVVEVVEKKDDFIGDTLVPCSEVMLVLIVRDQSCPSS